MRINCIVTHQTLAISAPEAAEKSVNYLECAFYFLTPDWQGLTKTAFFTGTDGKNYSAVIQDGTCVVPWEAIAEPGFLRMSVAGFGQMSLIITTDIASLRLRDTIFGGDPSQAPSPDQYTQIMQVLSGKVDTDQGVQNSGKVLGINDSGRVEPVERGSESSDLLWRPSVSESGDLSWTQDSSTDPPETVNIMGPQGPPGATPNIQIGTVQTLEPGQQATASIGGTPENPLLNLGIPKGEPGGGGIDNTSINLVNPYEYTNSGYSGTLFDEFGANVNVFSAEIDTSENKTLYYRVYRNNQVYDHKVSTRVACYDSGGSFLFLMNDSTGNYVANFESISRENGNTSEPLEIVGDKKVIVKQIALVNIPENVARVKFGIPGNSNMVKDFYPVFAVSYSKITNYGSITNSDYSLTQGSTSEGGVSGTAVYKPLLNKTFLMIGDSLANWGGGGDTSDGFLKIIHDRTGVNTVNQGLAGATWEEADGQTQPGVTRVDTYVSGSARYDCIGFLLGTNVANQGNTTDTSSTKTTMCGAIKYCLEKLIALSPTTPIIVFLPPQRAEGNAEQRTRNDMIKQICETYGVYTFDLYTRSQVIPNTTVEDNGTLSDGLHLSEKGQQNFGRIMSSAILSVMGY